MTLPTGTIASIPHVVKGVLVEGASVAYNGAGGTEFATPRLDLNDLVWSRNEPLPAAHVPVAEIIDLLVATGERLTADRDGFLAAALEALLATSPYERRLLENAYEDLGAGFAPDILRAYLDQELGGAEVVDGWQQRQGPNGRVGSVRAYPTRLVHVLAGNHPGVASLSVARGALTKGVHLLKMPSNDLMSATAVLRTMASVAPGHPVVRSFSAVYWTGGDDAVEGALFRSQFFDKIVAWGGDAAIRNAAKYLGPGFELIAFDPKSSISMIGREALDSDESIAEVARLAALDSAFFNQENCTTSRFHFVEESADQVDKYCAQLLVELGREGRHTSAKVPPLPFDTREEIDSLRSLEPMFRVFGKPDGRGLVVRSDEPVDFYPSGKTVNVVVVPSLTDALKHVNVATQTVGVYPAQRKASLRDALASAGTQRIVTLGTVPEGMIPGFPHDGFFPMHRFVRWVSDSG